MDTPPKKKKKYSVKVNYKWCKNCGICAAFCTKGVFKTDEFGKPTVVDEDKCIKCMLCVIRCPDFAVDVTDVKDED